MNETVRNTESESLANAADVLSEVKDPIQSFELNNSVKVTINKARTKDLGAILDIVNHAFVLLKVDKLGDLPKVDLEDPKVLLQLISKMHAPIIEATAQLSSLSLDEVNDLELDDLLTLVLRIVQLNKHFFLKRVLPTLNTLTDDQ